MQRKGSHNSKHNHVPMKVSLAQLRLLLWKSKKTAWGYPGYTIFEIIFPLVVLNILKRAAVPERLDFYNPRSVDEGFLEIERGTVFRYSCDELQCSLINKSLIEMCSNLQCQPIFDAENPEFFINAISKTSLDMTSYASKSFMDGFYRKESSDDFSYHLQQLNHQETDNFIGSFARAATNLSTPIVFHRLSTPIRRGKQCPVLLLHTPLLLPMTLVPVLAAISVAREIAVEKESGMKNFLLVMGMTRLTYYTHHLVFALYKSTPAIVGISVFVLLADFSLGLHFFIAFTLFVAAEVSLAMLIPSFIKRPTIATLYAFVIVPFNAVLGVTMPVPRTSILLSSLAALNPGHAMALAFDSLREGAYRGEVVWLWEANYALTYGGIILIMIFEIVLFITISVLIDIIESSSDNIFARFKKAVANEEEDEFDLNVHEENPADENAVVDVELIDVHKTYPSGERAVRGVSMELYRGQVTVLLGHNGAGKSTTFAMIAGITVPTSGTIRFGEPRSNTKRRRQKQRKPVERKKTSVGYCPQHNPIFPNLTVEEHLAFFSALKGRSDEVEYTAESEKLMNLLQLLAKRKELAKALSGGMKRKLSIAIALIGSSNVILLDEPTAGVDAGARRDIEKFIVSQKKDRTFLLTTHYTDEAENLGDRIMIMAGGKLVCSGSPNFLCKEFGAGYNLCCVVKKPRLLHYTAQATLQIAEKLIGGAKLKRYHGHQFEIWLDKASFPEFFRVLETDKDELGIESFGLTNNTLEQVFLRVGELTGVARQAKVKEALAVLLRENENRCAGFACFARRFAYLQYKRLLFEICEIRSVLINLLPIVMCIYSITLISGIFEKNYTNNIKGMEHNGKSIDALQFPYCMRLGIDHTLDLSEALSKSLPRDSCILIESVYNTTRWYESTAVAQRPPILATIDKHKKGLIVRMAPNAVLSTSPLNLALIRALTNTSFKVKVQFKHNPTRSQQQQSRKRSDITFIAVAIFLVVQPILIYRSIGFYVVERSIKFMHQQLLTGLPRWFYWISSFFADLTIFLLNYGFTVGCCIYFDVLMEELWRLTPFCLLIFLISQFKCYILQRFIDSKAKAENAGLVVMILSFIFVSTLFYNFTALKSPELGFLNIFYDFPLLLDPHTAVLAHFIGMGLTEKSSIYGLLLLQLSCVLLIFVLLEFWPTIQRMHKRRNSQAEMNSNATSTPLLETGSKIVLEVNNLVKSYGSTVAVKGISFGVEQHECFGLLGVNGAGKTSTFEVLTGSSLATSGSATVAGVDCSTPARIGYCPQFDALLQELSGRQNLVILAALHGYRNPGIVADTVIECVGMSAHANKKTKSYSGGQRRKISVAAALLAQNSLIILDEPTAGIDPVTRRDIWSVICALRDATETAIVLTSHSMDEVEALCSRIAVLRTGEIVAQGSAQSLKATYGNNFKLTLVVEGKSVEVVTTAVKLSFPRARRINTDSENGFTFEIPLDLHSSWSSMFSQAIDLARELEASDFCLSQASLEDAFIALTSDADPETVV